MPPSLAHSGGDPHLASRKDALLSASTSELTARRGKCHKMNLRPFIHEAPTEWPSCTPSGSVNYREAYGIHASNGILFNHESPIRARRLSPQNHARRGRYSPGVQKTLHIGNLDASATGSCRTSGRHVAIVQQPRRTITSSPRAKRTACASSWSAVRLAARVPKIGHALRIPCRNFLACRSLQRSC